MWPWVHVQTGAHQVLQGKTQDPTLSPAAPGAASQNSGHIAAKHRLLCIIEGEANLAWKESWRQGGGKNTTADE